MATEETTTRPRPYRPATTTGDLSTPVAAMVYIAWNGVWYYKFSASYPRCYRPNAAMIIEACRDTEEIPEPGSIVQR